jgi:hypothetical protein
MLDRIKERQRELEVIQNKIKHEPLVRTPFKDRDLLRFPSLNDDRKLFDKEKYIEYPAINLTRLRNNKMLNFDSAQRAVDSFYLKN